MQRCLFIHSITPHVDTDTECETSREHSQSTPRVKGVLMKRTGPGRELHSCNYPPSPPPLPPEPWDVVSKGLAGLQSGRSQCSSNSWNNNKKTEEFIVSIKINIKNTENSLLCPSK
ncbi:UNVERIFIED_CONTAM: hypothetical protein FKN15_057992 [Acipenser sinensis]